MAKKRSQPRFTLSERKRIESLARLAGLARGPNGNWFRPGQVYPYVWQRMNGKWTFSDERDEAPDNGDYDEVHGALAQAAVALRP